MTTVAERIAQVQAAAFARGMTASRTAPPRPNRPVVVRPHVEARRDPVADILRKPLPCSWQRAEGNASHHKRAEIKVAAWLIAKALGSDWRRIVIEREYSDCIRIEHKTGVQLSITCETYPRKYRYRIGCVETYQTPGSITVSAKRTPLAIAGDIENRLLAKGAIEASLAAKRKAARNRKEKQDERLKCLRMARAAGHRQIQKENLYTPQFTNVITNEIKLSSGFMTAGVDYCGRISIDIKCDPDLAEEIIRFAAIRRTQ